MKNFKLPKDYRPYIDKYFLRSKEILQKEGINPIVKYQVFIRNANCKIYGINEAIAIIDKYAPRAKVWALKEGSFAKDCETIMLIEGHVQDLIDLETMYLGVISAETTIKAENKDIDLNEVYRNMHEIVTLVAPRPVMYFGARHWRYDRDMEISSACCEAGAKDCSTDEGANQYNAKGVGTIPHALEAVYHWFYRDIGSAVVTSLMAFDKHIMKEIPRIALVDYANREITDSIQCLIHCKNLYGIRIDTCGENAMQGVIPHHLEDYPYLQGNGVTIAGVYAVRKILNDMGHDHIKVILSSGFAFPKKTKEFTLWEEGMKFKLEDESSPSHHDDSSFFGGGGMSFGGFGGGSFSGGGASGGW